MLSEKQITLLRRWLGISRTRIFTAVITPGLIGVTAAVADGYFSTFRFILLIIGLALAEMMNLFLADWTEYQKIDASRGRAIPPPHLEGSPMLSPRLLPLKYTLLAAMVTATLALAVLIYFVTQLGWPVLVLLVVAAFVGALYVAPPFPFAFFSTALLPPIIALGGYFVMAGADGLKASLSGLAVLFISAGVIYTYRVLYEPRVSGNFDTKRKAMRVLYALCYVTLLAVALSGIATRWILLGLLTLPVFFVLDRVTQREKTDHMPATSLGVLMHFGTGILIAIGYIISAYL